LPAFLWGPVVDLADHERLTIARGLRDDPPERICPEGRAPELDPVSGPDLRTRVPVWTFPLSAMRRGGQGVRPRPFVAYSVHRRDVASVGDGVAALDRAPGVELLGAVRRLLFRVPADRRR